MKADELIPLKTSSSIREIFTVSVNLCMHVIYMQVEFIRKRNPLALRSDLKNLTTVSSSIILQRNVLVNILSWQKINVSMEAEDPQATEVSQKPCSVS